MFGLFKKTSLYVQITSKSLSIYCLEKHPDIRLKNAQITPLNLCQIEEEKLFNPTFITHSLNQYIKDQKIKRASAFLHIDPLPSKELEKEMLLFQLSLAFGRSNISIETVMKEKILEKQENASLSKENLFSPFLIPRAQRLRKVAISTSLHLALATPSYFLQRQTNQRLQAALEQKNRLTQEKALLLKRYNLQADQAPSKLAMSIRKIIKSKRRTKGIMTVFNNISALIPHDSILSKIRLYKQPNRHSKGSYQVELEGFSQSHESPVDFIGKINSSSTLKSCRLSKLERSTDTTASMAEGYLFAIRGQL